MQSFEPPAYVILSSPPTLENLKDTELKKDLEAGTLIKKLEALKNLILLIASGTKLSSDILIYVIRFLIPVQDKQIKKHLLLFWELVPKYKSDGTLLSEMILVCDAYRKDLQHPNEYIRGSILRFLCKLKEPEILEPIVPAIKSCLDHRNAYVRRNAVFAIFTIYKNLDYLIPNAPELIENFLENESDPSCQRNAYMMLIHVDQQTRAINFLKTKVTSLLNFSDVLQLSIVELIYNYCIESHEKNVFLKYLYELLNAPSPAVRFSACNALLSLSDSSAACEYASKCYVDLILKESDNNVRLIVLDRISFIHSLKKHGFILQNIALDLLGVLCSGGTDTIIDVEVARRILTLVSDLLSVDKVKAVINFFKKEIQRIQKRFIDAIQIKKISSLNRDVIQYHSLIIHTIRSICDRFKEFHQIIAPLLIRTLDSTHSSVSLEVLDLIRSVIFTNSEIRATVFHELLSVFKFLKDANTFRSSLWILSSCISSIEQIESLINCLLKLTEVELDQNSVRSYVTTGPDGNYITSQAVDLKTSVKVSFFLNFEQTHKFILSCLSTVLLKIVALHKKMSDSPKSTNIFKAKCIILLVKLLSIYKEKCEVSNLDIDMERTYNSLTILASDSDLDIDLFNDIIDLSDKSMMKYIHLNREQPEQLLSISDESAWNIDFGSLLVSAQKKRENILEKSLLLATGKVEEVEKNNFYNKVIPLTGISDAVYAEASIRLVNFDVHFDVLVVNQTDDFIQNVQLEFRTHGDYKVLTKSQNIVLSSMKFGYLSSVLRFTSTDSNIVFGTIIYETSGSQRDTYSVILDEIKLDLMETSQPSYCSEDEFQKMWAEFEWEKKVIIDTPFKLEEILDRVLNITKMTEISHDSYHPDCHYFVSNLYIRNRFGDEGIANLSVQKKLGTSETIGHARIRAKTQTMALTLGDKFTECFKN